MTEGYADVNGVRLWYEQLGEPTGDPVVLVMGVGASSIWWPPELVEALVAAGCGVVNFDNRDIGLSSHIDYERDPYGVGDMVTDTLGLLDAIDADRAHFVGSSLGGIISQLMALHHPDRVRSLVLISSTPGRDERLSPPADAFMAYVTRAIDPDEDPIDGTVGFCRALSGTRFPFDEPYYRQLATADIARGTNLDSNQGRIPASSSSRIDDLATVGAPTLVVHGTEDPLFPFDHAEALAGAIPGARLVAWDGVGHELPPQLVPELAALVVRHVAQS